MTWVLTNHRESKLTHGFSSLIVGVGAWEAVKGHLQWHM